MEDFNSSTFKTIGVKAEPLSTVCQVAKTMAALFVYPIPVLSVGSCEYSGVVMKTNTGFTRDYTYYFMQKC